MTDPSATRETSPAAGARSAVPATPEQAFLVARVIFFAIAFSPLLLGLAAWFVTDGGAAPFAPVGSAGLYAWAGLTVGGFLLWRFAWGGARRRLERIERGRPDEDAAAPLRFQRQLILAWAGAEMAGIAGAVSLLLAGSDLLFLISLLFAGLLHHVSRPRRRWYADAPAAPVGG